MSSKSIQSGGKSNWYLQRNANADIIIQLTYVINQKDPQIHKYLCPGPGCLYQKQIAGAQGTGEPSFATQTPIIGSSGHMHIDDFNTRLQAPLWRFIANGREVVFQARRIWWPPADLEEALPIKMNRLNWEKLLRIG